MEAILVMLISAAAWFAAYSLAATVLAIPHAWAPLAAVIIVVAIIIALFIAVTLAIAQGVGVFLGLGAAIGLGIALWRRSASPMPPS